MKMEQSLLEQLNSTLLVIRMGSASHDHRGVKMQKAKCEAYEFLKKHGKTLRVLVQMAERDAVADAYVRWAAKSREDSHERS